MDGRGGRGGVRSVRPRGSVSGEGSGRSSYPNANAGRPLDATRCAAVGAACTAPWTFIPRAYSRSDDEIGFGRSLTWETRAGAPRRAGPTDALTPRAGATAETVKADMFACFEVMRRVDSLCCDVRDDATRATLRDPALRTETGDDAGAEVLIFRNRRLEGSGSRYGT